MSTTAGKAPTKSAKQNKIAKRIPNNENIRMKIHEQAHACSPHLYPHLQGRMRKRGIDWVSYLLHPQVYDDDEFYDDDKTILTS